MAENETGLGLAPALFGRRVLWVVLGLLVGIAVVDSWRKRQQEQHYDGAIVRAAQRHNVSPGLIKALVWRESKFDPSARGRSGEVGLMQIRPLAAQEWAQAQTRRSAFDGDLFNPETNLEVGTWYLGKLLRRYGRTDNPVAYALADYNAGRVRVLRWNKGAAETNSALFVSQITFPGTQAYVESVIRQSAKYQAVFKPGDCNK